MGFMYVNENVAWRKGGGVGGQEMVRNLALCHFKGGLCPFLSVSLSFSLNNCTTFFSVETEVSNDFIEIYQNVHKAPGNLVRYLLPTLCPMALTLFLKQE